MKANHIDKKVNNKFYEWCALTYGSEETGHVTVTCGKKHDYLAMIFWLLWARKIESGYERFVKGMIEEYPEKLSGKASTPWKERLMKVDKNSKKVGCWMCKYFSYVCYESHVFV